MASPAPKLLASTGTTYSGTILDTSHSELHHLKLTHGTPLPPDISIRLLKRRRLAFENDDERNVFRQTQWTPDGTSLVTVNEDGGVRLFIVPPELLEPREEPLGLHPYSLFHYPEPVYSMAIYPFFSLQDSATTLAVISTPDRPLTLQSLLYPTWTQSYPNIDVQTEKYLPAYSLLFTSNPSTLLAGSENQIALFDINRPGDMPETTLYTTPAKGAPMTSERMKGIISAMGMSSGGILAAGTFSGGVGLYDSEGSGSTISVFDTEGRGGGVTGLKWSPDGRYLYVISRRSSEILVYDVRVMGRLCGFMKGFKGETNQRINVDVMSNGEVWAGGTDGIVRVWDKDEGEGCIREWQAHEDTVSSVVIHPSSSVVATCSGRRTFAPDDEPEDEEVENDASSFEQHLDVATEKPKPENSLKIWSL